MNFPIAQEMGRPDRDVEALDCHVSEQELAKRAGVTPSLNELQERHHVSL